MAKQPSCRYMREFHYNSGFMSRGGCGLQDLATSHLTAPSCISAGFLLQPQELLAALNTEIGLQPMGQTPADQTHVPLQCCGTGAFPNAASISRIGVTPEAKGGEGSPGVSRSKIKPLQAAATRQNAPAYHFPFLPCW